jgi:hypothetical protein
MGTVAVEEVAADSQGALQAAHPDQNDPYPSPSPVASLNRDISECRGCHERGCTSILEVR